MSFNEYIASPRSIFKDKPDDVKKGVQRLKLGSTSAGIVLDISKKGITINGYYQSSTNEGTFYACVREPVEIAWEEFEKLRQIASERKKRKASKKIFEPDKIDKPDKKYLDKLPVVTINKKLYYLDAELRQRRPVDKPENVFNY